MAMAGPGCGHELQPGVRFCTVCGAARPEPDSSPSGEPGPPPRWGSPEFYAQTVDARGFRSAPAEPAPSYPSPPAETPPSYQAAPVHQPAPVQPPAPVYQPAQAAPGELALYRPLAAPQSPPQALPRPPGPRRDRSRLRGVLIGLGTFLAAAAVAAAVMLIAHPFQRGATPAPTTSAAAPASGTASSPAAQPAQEQAAQGLAALLAQSVTDRSSIVAAVSDVSQCGPNLHQDPQTFQAAVTSRQNLLSRLTSLPDRSALSASMLADLTSAWQNSIKADQDYAQWAQDEISGGCTSNNESDPAAQAATAPDTQATTDKKAFAGAWNPVATRYGLPTYQWNQL
jgi:eukaryotic-like serine/threonine-protein kinase